MAREPIEIENYIIHSGEVMRINASAFDKNENLIISFQASLTSLYNPNVQKEANVLIYYTIVKDKTEVFPNIWNPTRFRIAMLSYYIGFKNLTLLTIMQMFFAECALASMAKEFHLAAILTVIVMISYCIVSLAYYRKTKKAMDMMKTLRSVISRKESESAYIKCVEFINKNDSLIDNYHSIGTIQFLIIALITGICLLLKQLL